ncbi:MAG TPA: N-formylglutamate amidohydrolase [Allosphingosinicella sp.]
MRVGPGIAASPVVLSVPHAGRAYSPALLKASRLPVAKLESLEDRLVDRLIWRAVAEGSTALVAQTPRAEIDLNRDEREVDAAMVSPPPAAGTLLASARTRGGLGLVPSRISGSGAIWLQRMTGVELRRRIDEVHRPYHAALARLLEEARGRFGVAVLLDCHSMPSRHGEADSPDIVFGDRHGASIAPNFLAVAVEAAESAGFRTERNTPYAGGYITARHGRPDRNIHALQLEIDRSVYLGPDLRSPGSGFEKTARMIAAVAGALARKALEPAQDIAAE